ncbi:hypothetical protein DQ04_00811110 [Trypanosoma grayi]|uniref:hypothetical protein n=1 Tax=Trypanosoma grayi TaxID=71804 RepID=UPI0004F42D25|nr:hypothetical protein DQ04_00811110 [Trypanosoma grayi]KEG13751.1 hypothetical protein DQ04_00811110 [Trypanosoma grayi]
MRRLFGGQLLGVKHRRLIVDAQAFFELYGRRPDAVGVQPSGAESPASSCPGDAAAAAAAGTSLTWRRALDEISAQLYVAPNSGVSRAATKKALEALTAAFALPRDRRARYCQGCWEHALDVWAHTDKNDLHSAVLLITVLFYNGKYDLLAQHVESCWLSGSPQRVLRSSNICHSLRLMAVYVLACSLNGTHVQSVMLQKVKEIAERALRCASGEATKESALEYRLLLYAMDWYFFHTDDLDLRKLISSTFSPLTPSKLRPFLFVTTSPHHTNIVRDMPPATILREGKHCATNCDKEGLLRLFTHCRRREESQSGFRLFQLSTRLGDMLSLMPDTDSRLLSDVITFCGTSLSFEALTKIGATRRCLPAVLQVLGSMEGAEAYFAARQVLFHHDSKEALTFQEKYGDILTGDSKLVWRTGLESMQECLARGDMKWRGMLPSVLRLLSDAGETVKFFQLLRESHREGEGASLMVASALGQAARRSGQWWRAHDVLDIIAACDPPRTVSEDRFLEDACLQTLYALRDGKRWKEALSFYKLLAPAMPKTAHRVLCSVVCGMPASSPWEEALAMAQGYGDVPEDFLTSLLCARDPDRVAHSQRVSARSWRYMLQGYAEGGHWRHALQHVCSREKVNFNAWVAVLRAAQRTPLGSLSRDFFEFLPETVWRVSELLRLSVLVAEGHGYLKELHDVLQSRKEGSLAAEYHALVRFLMDGRAPPRVARFTDDYVIHRLLMSPVSSVESVFITVAWTMGARTAFNSIHCGDMKSFIQARYKVHPLCLPGRCKKAEQDVFTLRAIPPQVPSVGDETLVAVRDDVIVAYKPPGVATHSYARSVAQRSKTGGMHYLAYLLTPPSCGLVLLVASNIPTKAVCLEMKVLLRICPTSSASPPLMSSEFFAAYAMEVVLGPASDGCVVVRATCCSDSDGLLAGSLYRLKESIAAGGWGFWEGDTGDSDNGGECVHLAEVAVRIHHTGSEVEPMHFSLSHLPAWSLMTMEEQPCV